MKSIKAVLYGKPIRCPCCGSKIELGATIRMKGEEIGQDKLDDYPMPENEDMEPHPEVEKPVPEHTGAMPEKEEWTG